MVDKTGLKRELGLFEVTLAGLGVILGAGIYVLIGRASGLTGNTVWLSFVFSAAIALLTGFSYAELSSIFPHASAEYEYTRNAFGSIIAFTIGWLVIFSGIIASAAVALGFGGYFQSLFGVHHLLSACLLIIALTILISYGIKESTWFIIVSTIIEAGALIGIVVISVPSLGSVSYFDMPHGFKGVLEATALIFFSYLGFEEIVKLSEETRDPTKVMPRALLLAIPISTLIYVLVGISVVSLVNWQDLGNSDAPLADAVRAALKTDMSLIMSIIALLATANTALVTLLTTSRIVYGIAQSGSFPRRLGQVHRTRGTPWVASACVGAVSLLFVFGGDTGLVASTANFALFVTFIAINGSVIYLRYKNSEMSRSFKTPIAVGRLPLLPVFGIFSCLLMLAQLSPGVLAVGACITIAGVAAGFLTGRKKGR
ncbi:MAG TPA: amino acid permease [Syntrophorhabdaceae bacterium]|nr:amino acid permease [Syntrophorhabdaceae bacterium]